jgi:hypothetical protein
VSTGVGGNDPRDPAVTFVTTDQFGAVASWAMIDERVIAEAAPRSNLDFLVVEPKVDDDGGEAVRLMRGLHDLRVPTDVIVVSERRRGLARCPSQP